MESLNNIQDSFKKIVSVTYFRRLISFSLTITWTFYFGSMDYSMFEYSNFKNLLENFTILKFIAISLFVSFLFYKGPKFFLRLLFHGYVKDKFLKIRQSLLAEGRMSYLKSMHFAYGVFNFIFKDYVCRLGFLSKKDLEEELEITESDKEEFLNEALCDCYQWICINIHFILTLTIVWNYLNFWVLLSLVLILIYTFLLPIGIIVIAMNLDLFNRFRRKALTHKFV